MNIHPLNDIDGYKVKQKPSERLMNVLGFSKGDLECNQQGKMSANQRSAYLNKRKWYLLGSGLCILGFMIVWFGGRELSVFLVGFVIGIFVCGMNAYRFYSDGINGVVASSEGRIDMTINGRRFSIAVEGQQFDLRQKAFLAFKNGDPYRLYYTPRTKQLLSAEWLRD